MKRCVEARDSSATQLRRIAEGWRFQAGVGTGSWIDVTDEIAEREGRSVRNMDQLIGAFTEGFAGGLDASRIAEPEAPLRQPAPDEEKPMMTARQCMAKAAELNRIADECSRESDRHAYAETADGWKHVADRAGRQEEWYAVNPTADRGG